jgi:hypothetical protein
VALPKLAEEARRANQGKDLLRAAQEAAYKFMSATAGNEPGYEEAPRALFGHNETGFHELAEAWPPAVRKQATKLAAAAFAGRPCQLTVHRALPQYLHSRAVELSVSPQVKQRTAGALAGFRER